MTTPDEARGRCRICGQPGVETVVLCADHVGPDTSMMLESVAAALPAPPDEARGPEVRRYRPKIRTNPDGSLEVDFHHDPSGAWVLVSDVAGQVPVEPHDDRAALSAPVAGADEARGPRTEAGREFDRDYIGFRQRIIRIEDEARAAVLSELDAAYRERNAVVAALIRTNGWPRWVAMAPDADGWVIAYAETPQGQVSWHVGPDDFDLFADFPTVAPGGWDGHTTEEKYRRLAALSAEQGDGL